MANLNPLVKHLLGLQQAELMSLIPEFSVLFSDALGQTDIDVGEAKPIYQCFYCVSYKQQHIQSEIRYMVDHGITKPSFSSWASSCLLVGKPDGTYYFCTDYRKLNSVTKPDSFPLPRMENCIDQTGSATYVSKFHLLKGYWQVRLSPFAHSLC